jgi:hypothetical protein
MAANVRRPERDVDVPLISDPLTARVTDLFNVGYEILLQALQRFFAHTDETDEQLQVLADAAVGLMLTVIKPLGDLITTLPVGAEYPGLTAGPSFELFYETDYLLPHLEAAWALLAERLDETAQLCDRLEVGQGKVIADRLAPVQAAMRKIARSLAVHLPEEAAHASLASAPESPAAAATPQAAAPDEQLPGPGQAVGFEARIKPLFRDGDRQSMSWAFDLWSYDDVRTHAAAIFARLQSGTMPCDGAWPDARIAVFKRWIDGGSQP